MSETYGEKLSFDENASYWRCFSAKQTFEVNNGQNIFQAGCHQILSLPQDDLISRNIISIIIIN
jgi:hypothetical protein